MIFTENMNANLPNLTKIQSNLTDFGSNLTDFRSMATDFQSPPTTFQSASTSHRSPSSLSQSTPTDPPSTPTDLSSTLTEFRSSLTDERSTFTTNGERVRKFVFRVFGYVWSGVVFLIERMRSIKKIATRTGSQIGWLRLSSSTAWTSTWSGCRARPDTAACSLPHRWGSALGS